MSAVPTLVAGKSVQQFRFHSLVHSLACRVQVKPFKKTLNASKVKLLTTKVTYDIAEQRFLKTLAALVDHRPALAALSGRTGQRSPQLPKLQLLYVFAA